MWPFRSKPSEEPKLCVSCVHHEKLLENHYCNHPLVAAVDIVTGIRYNVRCTRARASHLSITCGPRGKFFVPR